MSEAKWKPDDEVGELKIDFNIFTVCFSDLTEDIQAALNGKDDKWEKLKEWVLTSISNLEAEQARSTTNAFNPEIAELKRFLDEMTELEAQP